MANTVYDKKVVFTSRHFKKEVFVKLHTQNVPIWIPLQITEKSTRSLILHFSLDDGSKTSRSLVLTVPLHVNLSPDVNDYTCEALFQDCRDGKELIKVLKETSNVGSFSVDVTHTPPSTYTVTDLKESTTETGTPLYGPSQVSSQLDFSIRDIQEGLRKLCIFSTSTARNGLVPSLHNGLVPSLHNGLVPSLPLSDISNSNDHQVEIPVTTSRNNNRQNNALKWLSLIFLKDVETGVILLYTTEASQFTFPFQLRPISDYELMVFRGCQIQDNCFLIKGVTLCSFRSYMTTQEVNMLYVRACSHVSSMGMEQFAKFIPISHLYRSKPILHFLNIYNNTNGIMYKYIKNFGGDPSSTLNRKLHGLFFSANVDPLTGLPPAVSYYGNQRIHIPVRFMINSDINLYFADFYCHYVNHHVTLVITVKGSEADLFCSKRLMPLDPNFNVFLFRRPHDLHAMVNSKVTVEVFYTESINIVQMLKTRCAFLTSVTQKGNAALKTAVGLPKRQDCKICNLKTNS
ncbi:phytanoyl-CoA hydroxylase-interacting protein-like [Saccostrea echinata]|uniref:phytanoyl-CoA hydroxylase-interacting protein-like n=1 Tax=Saccostrea echinata TaxID=191078 RepID=UPI002A811741|nr:phytanoyl-CoA hydroxylase-interacting protein-like [Saccostrea echinata]